MKIFQNRNIFKKLIIVLLVIMIFSFCMPKNVRAEDGIGGKLLDPIMSFFVGLGDGTMTLIQKMVLQIDESIIPIDTSSSFWAKVIVIVAAIVVVSVIIIATVLTAGAAGAVTMAGIAAALKGAAAVAITIGVTTITFPITTQVVEGMLPDDFKLPMFEVTPQEIFSNKIPLLDVDFFNPSDTVINVDNTNTEEKQIEDDTNTNVYDYIKEKLRSEYGYNKSTVSSQHKNKGEGELYGGPEEYTQDTWDYNGKTYTYSYSSDGTWLCNRHDATFAKKDDEYLTYEETSDHDGLNLKWKENGNWDDGRGSVTVKGKTETITTGEKYEVHSTAKELRNTISSWYVVLRDLSLVSLLSVLVYVGIRIIISSTAQDKAKYKQMLVDWIVAICLLFAMQYIMSFSNMLVKKIIEIVDTTYVSADEEKEITEPEVFLITEKKKVSKAYEVIVGDQGDKSPYYDFFVDNEGNPAGSDATVLAWPAENFMQQARIKLQLLEDDEDTYIAIGWKLIYIALVIYTVIFIFTYLKRVIYMAFLTIIAPLVALTYPIDKMNDGKAQAFDMWFKEYIFNLLIQPMHLILYTILIGSAMEFASRNILYVVVALFFMVPAEKLLRRFFGFEKAHTPGLLAGPAGAAIMMTGMNKLLGRKSTNSNSSSKSLKDNNSSDTEDKTNLRFNENFDKIGSMLPDKDNKLKNKEMLQQKIMEEQAKQEAKQNMKNNSNKDLKGNKQTDLKMNSYDNQGKKPGKLKRLGLAAIRSGRYYGHKKLEKVGKRIQNSHPVKTGLKLYGGLAAGAAGAILGGISGDPTKMAQYTMTGAMGGYKSVDAILPNFSNDEDWNTASKIGKESYYGDEIGEHNMKEYIRDFQKNYDNKIELERKLGSKKEADQFLSNYSEDYIRNGITDIDDMITGYKLEKNGTVSNRTMGIATVKYAKRVGSKISEMKDKDKKDWYNTFAAEFKKNPRFKNSNLDVDEEVKNVISRIDAFYNTKNN